MAEPQQQWLSILEYARTFQISDMTIRRRIRSGRLPAVLKEGKYYIPVSSLPEKRMSLQPALTPSSQQLSFSQRGLVLQPGTIETRDHGLPQTLSPLTDPIPEPPASEALLASSKSRPVETPSGTGSAAPAIPPVLPSLPSSQTSSSSRLGSMIPSALSNPLLHGAHPTLLDGRKLLRFCEEALRQRADLEDSVKEQFHLKIQNLESQLNSKDRKIEELSQQIEDLELLLKMMDQRLQKDLLLTTEGNSRPTPRAPRHPEPPPQTEGS